MCLAYDWDNVGLLVGDFDSDVKKVMTVLEANEAVVDEAIEKGVDLVVTHHPFIFGKINRVNTGDLKGNLIHKLIKNDIAVYSMHTNFDIADLVVTHHPFIFGKINRVNTGDLKGNLIHKLIKNDIAVYSMHTNFDIAFDGLNDYFMEVMDFKDTKVLDKIDSDENYCEGRTYGLGRIGKLEESVSLKELCEKLKSVLNIECLRVVGDLDKEIFKVAVVTGSGSEFAKLAAKEGADVILTGDVKYHEAQDVFDMGMNLVDCGHFDSENIFKDVMYNFLSNELDGVEVIKSETNLNPFKIEFSRLWTF